MENNNELRQIWIAASKFLGIFLILLLILGGIVTYKLFLSIERIQGLVSDTSNNLFIVALMSYSFSSHGMILGGILKVMTIFIGAAVAAMGLMISFYTHKQTNNLDINNQISLKTYSPGIFAVVAGSMIIIFSITQQNTYSLNLGSLVDAKNVGVILKKDDIKDGIQNCKQKYEIDTPDYEKCIDDIE